MTQVIDVPGFGPTEFPDGMSDDQITAAIQKNMVPPKQPNVVERIVAGNPVDNSIVRSLFGGLYGLGEAGTQAISGAAGAAAGGLRGLYGLATGDTLDEAANKVTSTQNAMTYQPKTNSGQAVSTVINAPMEYGNKALGYVGGQVGQALNGQQGQIAGEALGQAILPVAGTLLGGRAALNSASASAAAGTAAKTDAAAQAAIESGNNAAKLDNVAMLRRKGLVVNPSETNPSFGNNLGAAITGDTGLNQGAYRVNQPIVNSLVRKELGIPEGTALTSDALKPVKQGFVDVQNEIKAVPKFKTDSEYVDGLNNRSFITALPEEEQALLKNSDQVNALVEQAALPEITGAGAIAIMRELRAKSSRVLNNPNADPAATALADAQRNVAKQIEAMIQRRLTAEGNADLATRFAQQRTLYAKAKTYENVLTGNGDVNVLKLRNNKGHTSFTGNLSDLYDAATAFPEAFTPPAPGGRGLNLTVGGRWNKTLDIASTPIRNRMLSQSYQNKYAAPPDARPLRQRMGYEEPGLLTGQQP